MGKAAIFSCVILTCQWAAVEAQIVSSRVPTDTVWGFPSRAIQRLRVSDPGVTVQVGDTTALSSKDLQQIRGLAATLGIDTAGVATDSLSFPVLRLRDVEAILPDEAQQSVRKGAEQPTWLGQTGITLGDGTTPELRGQIYKYRLGLGGGRSLPFFLLGGLPIVGRGDIDDTVESVLNEYGGTLNVAVGSPCSPLPHPGGFLDFPENSPFGLCLSARGGLKIVDVQSADPDADASVVGLALGLVSAKLLLPVWPAESGAGPNDRAGSVLGELTAAIQWSNDEDYRSVFSETDLISESLFYVNANVALIVTDQFYAAASFTLHADEDRFDRKSTVTFSYLR